MTNGARQDSHSDLDTGLMAAAEMNKVIVAADAKAGFVLAAHGALVAGLASSAPVLRLAVVAMAAIAGVVVLLLVASLWPRTADPTARWFAYPALRPAADGHVPTRPDMDVLADQAWAQAIALAAIARRKYRWFRAALAVGAVDLVAFCACVAVVGSSR